MPSPDEAGTTSGPDHDDTGPPTPVPAPSPVPVAVHRLRDLDRGGRALAAALALLLMVPVGASVVRALDVGWLPSGDDALIILRSYDVFSRHPPLIGQPSSAEIYAPGVAARHPGPIEFYLLAGPIRLLGPVLGTLLTMATVAGASVLVAAWVAFRRGGPAVGIGAALSLSVIMWSFGTVVLSDPISSNAGTFPLVAGVALSWALWCDDRRLWPLAVAVWSFTIQQHLAIFGAAGLVAAWGVAGAVATTLVHRQELGRLASAARWGAASLAVGLVTWLPPLIDQLAGSGNLATIFHFSNEGGRAKLGWDTGLHAAGRAFAAPPLTLTRRFTTEHFGGWLFAADLSRRESIGALIGVAVVALTGVAAARAWRRGQDRTAGPRLALVATGLVLVVAGIVTTSQVPDSVEASRINFYRWAWPASTALWAAVAWTVGGWASRRWPPRPALKTGAVGVATAVLTGLAWATATGQGQGDIRRDEVLFPFDRRAADAVLDAAPPDRPVRLITHGRASYLAIAPALGVALVEAGFEVRVEPNQEAFWDHRAGPRELGETVVHVISAPGEAPPIPGVLLASERLPLEPGGREEVWADDVFEVRLDLPPG